MHVKVPSIALVVFMLWTSSFLSGQIFRVQGGTSTLLGAGGASVEIKAPDYEAQIGAGLLNGQLQYGFLVRTKFMGDTLTVGDDTIKTELPTDVFESSHYFLSRGISLQHLMPGNKGRWYAFAGTTSLGYSTPFFMASRSESGLGAFYYERQLNTGVRFFSRTLLSNQQTSIHGIEWKAAPSLRLAASGGIGSNQPYLATSLRWDSENLIVRASYVAEGDKFQRMQVPSPISSELEKENIAAVYRVTRRVSVRGTHENILEPAFEGAPLLRAKVDEAYANLNVARVDVGAGVIKSSSTRGGNTGINLYATRAITRMISVNGNLYQSRPDIGSVSNMLATTVREQVSQKLALTQTVVRSNGQTSSGFGGELIGNRFSAYVGYQTVYVPFRPDHAFQQAMSFNAHVNLPRNMQLTAGSFVDSQGKVRYTIGIGTYFYRMSGMAGPASSETFRFPKFMAAGVVVDVQGNPVEGAAIHVDGKVAYSDSNGMFMIRLSKPGPHSVAVAMDEFTAPGTWQVVEAPESMTAQPEDGVTPIRIVLQRVRTSPAATPTPAPATK